MKGTGKANFKDSHAPRAGLRGDIIVAIPTLNEEKHIAHCVRSLTDDTAFAARIGFVVADGGSTDETRAIVDKLAQTRDDIVLLDNPERLQSAGINSVVAQLTGPAHRFLVRCDAHAHYPAGFVRRVVEVLEKQPEAASVAGVLDARGEGCFQRAAAWIVDTPLGSGGSAHRGGAWSGWVDHGHHAGFRLDWFRRIGGYDPDFSHNEDAEYDARLARAGGRIWLESSLRKNYVMRPTPGRLWLQYWRYGKGRARTLRKHALRPRLRQVLPVLVLAGLVLSLATGLVFRPALALPALYVGALSVVSAVAAARMRSLCGLWAGVALFVMHNAWGAGFLGGIMVRGARP